MGILYIVATPIGNLEDITLRAINTLRSVDLILAEDTRVTRKILQHYNIDVSLESFHQHTTQNKLENIAKKLIDGYKMALVSDAGTPGIHDPGQRLIQYIVEEGLDIKIVPIPGASAVTAILSIAGLDTDSFLFLGYPPHKKGRQKFFEEIKTSKHPVVFFESVHRIEKALNSLSEIGREIIVLREATKQFETIYRGLPEKVLLDLDNNLRGEFVIIVNNH